MSSSTTIKAVRTPEERFQLIQSRFPYEPRYVDTLPGYENLRMCYYDTKPGGVATPMTFLCLHGEPSWSYLYRKMIPVLEGEQENKNRVICVDLFGFGRSDKPVEKSTYTFNFHRNSLLRLVEHLRLENVTLVCQDWGGVLGLTLPMEFAPSVFVNILVMNTALAIGRGASKGFKKWKVFAKHSTEIPVSGLIALDVGPSQMNLLDALAYDAPFPDLTFKAGVQQFPLLVPVQPEMEGADIGMRAAKFYRSKFRGKAFVAVGVRDEVIGATQMEGMRKYIFPQAPPVYRVEDGGHFVQEYGSNLAKEALQHFQSGAVSKSKL